MQWAKFRNGEAHFHAIIDATPDAFVAVDLAGTVVAFNRLAEALFGVPASAVLGNPVAGSCLPDSLRQGFAVSLRRACAGGATVDNSLEIEGRHASGQAFVAEASFFAAKAGKETVLAARIHDITARRQAEQRLNRILRTMKGGNQALVRATSEEELFQAICNVIVDTGGFRMAWIGQVEHDEEKLVRPLAYAGYEEGYLSAIKISWGENPHSRGPCGMAVRTGIPQINNDFSSNPVMVPWREQALERGYHSSISLPLRDKAGVFGALTIYASETHAFGPEEVALLVELAGDVSYGVTALRTRRDRDEMARLIDERKRAENALRDTKRRFELALANSHLSVFEQDLDLRYTWFWNPKLGYALDEVIGKTDADLMDPACLPELERVKRRVIATGQRIRQEVAAGAPGGPIEYYDLTVEPRRDEAGRIVGIACASADVTAARAIRDALQISDQRLRLAMEMNATVAYTMDRDLRCTWIRSPVAGNSVEGTLGKTLHDVWAGESADRIASYFREVLRTGQRFRGDIRVQSRFKSHPQDFDFAVEPLRDAAGAIAGIIVAATDITERKRAEAALRESEAQFRTLADAIPQLAWMANADGWLYWYNRRWYEYTGTTPEQMEGWGWQSVHDPKTLPEVLERWKRSIATGEPFDMVFPLRGANGVYQLFLTRVQPLKNAEGRVVRWFGTNTDVDELKRAESALRESEERLRLALDAGSMAAWDWHIPSNAVLWNDEHYRVMGYKPGEVEPSYEAWARRVLPEDFPATEALLQQCLQEGRDYHTEFRVLGANGQIRWLEARGRFEHGKEGQPVRSYGVMMDITGRKQAEAALRESEERFRGIYEHAATGISILNLQGQFQSCNPAYSAMVGYTGEELRGINFQDLVHPADIEANMLLNRQLLAREIPSFELVNRYVRKDGKPIWVHKHISLLRDAAGAPASLIALVTDITERKLHEERIDLLMHEVNHRAKNMLAVVLAVARQTIATQPQDFIARFGQRIQAMAASQDLLVKNEWKGVPIGELVRSQLAHFHDLIGTRIELQGPSLFISASAAQTLGMALHELATNAGKYGALSDGGGRLQVEWSLEGTEGGEGTFVISWRELGGPPVTAPAKRGFGSTVISRMAKEGLDAKVNLDFAPAGLVWRLESPSKEVTGRSH
ncbi:MAG: PAS domain S-box protein [Rhodomicrobium sp.]